MAQHEIPSLDDLLKQEAATAAWLKAHGVTDMTCDRPNHDDRLIVITEARPEPRPLEPARWTLARQLADAQKRATFKQIIYGADSPQYRDAALVVEALKSQQKREAGS